MKRMKLLFTLALPVILLQSAQAQTMSRLIAKADWANDGTQFYLVDTTDYTYLDSMRGGDLTHPLLFDYAEMFSATDTSLNPSTLITQTYDATNTILQSATTQVYSEGISGTWSPANQSKLVYFYNALGQLDTMVYQLPGSTAWIPSAIDIYTYYPGTNNLFSDTHGTWNGYGGWDTSYQITYYYTGAGKVFQKTTTNYGAGGWVPAYQYNYSYNSSNWLTSYTYGTWNGGGYTTSYMYSYTYDSSGDRLTATKQTYNASGSPVNSTLQTYSMFTSMGSNLPQAELDQSWDTASGGYYYNTRNWAYSYNTFKQMTQSIGESWNEAGFWEFANGDPMSDYWYSTYTPTTSVTNVVNTAGDVNIYPNPVMNMININLNWNEAQAFTVSIFDMKGALVSSWSVPATAQYTTSVSMEGYNSGLYVVNITGTAGTISRQVVVAH